MDKGIPYGVGVGQGDPEQAGYYSLIIAKEGEKR